MDIKPLNVEIQNLKNQVDKVHLMLDRENFNYNVIESQFENLRIRNQKLNDENLVIEKRIKDSLDAAEKIVQEARKQESEIKTASMILYHKAQNKYKGIEETLSKSEKKQITEHMKELETLAV